MDANKTNAACNFGQKWYSVKVRRLAGYTVHLTVITVLILLILKTPIVILLTLNHWGCAVLCLFSLKGRGNHFNILNWLCQQPHLPAAADASTSHTPTTTAASATVPRLPAPLGALLHHHLPHRQSLDLPWPVHHLRHAAPQTAQLGKVQQRAGRAVFWTGKGSVD